jgi:hypothetical protein
LPGNVLLLLGTVILVAPGPGILTITVGLGILSADFSWVRQLLRTLRKNGAGVASQLFEIRPRCFIDRSVRLWHHVTRYYESTSMIRRTQSAPASRTAHTRSPGWSTLD